MRRTSHKLCAGWLAGLLIVGLAWGEAADSPTAKSTTAKSPAADSTAADARPFGIEQRVPLTTSRVVGSPDPPLLCKSVPAFPKLKFTQPLYLLAEPASDRLLVVEQKGKIRAFPNIPDVEQTDLFLEIADRDTYGMTFHPDYAGHRYVYVFSNGPNSEKRKRNRISRFTVSPTPPCRCLPDSEVVLLEWESNGHNGGDLGFGPDGYLYITSGDGTSDSDGDLTGQKLSDLNSGVLRIDVDNPTPGQRYSVPKDNPFLEIESARPELWAYGFRNPWRMHFDPRGNLWVGDIGQDLWEMIEIVHRGDNFGWSVNEGTQPFYLERQAGPHPFTPPLIQHSHAEARSITGGVTYHGTRFPELDQAYIYGDYGTGKIWACRYENGKIVWHREIDDTPFQILGFGADHAGELYYVDYQGGIYTFERRPQIAPSTEFPRTLSETGLFVSVPEHKPQPGLIPYSVNSPLWSDNSLKERFIALPGTSQIEFTRTGPWKFPEQTVLVKTFALERELGNPQTQQRLETRLMVLQQGEWVGYSYRWNEEQTEATLVESEGEDRQVTIHDPQVPGGTREQTWRYPSRAECMVCHSRAAGFVLGPHTPQLNKLHDYGRVSDNQIRTLEHLGVLKMPGGGKLPGKIPSPENLARLANPGDSQEPLEARVRSYLHANCAQCHVAAGGGNSAIQLGFVTPLPQTRLIGVPPLHDKLGIENPLLVAPGTPERSILLKRMSHPGRGHMPPLGTSVIDKAAVELVKEWILQLPAEK